MQSKSGVVVILGTGGTIAGTAANAQDNVGYKAAQLKIESLVKAVPLLAGQDVESEQVAQINSKDMTFAVWRTLAQRVAHHLARAEVRGIVVAHGTDTMEETAYLLQRVLAPAKPVVITGAMRPSTAVLKDGPQNLLDAVAVAHEDGARGVMVAMAGLVFGAIGVRKAHTYRLDAFEGGDAGPLGRVEEGRLRRLREWPSGEPLGLERLQRAPADWPRVDIVLNHAGADGHLVRALLAQGVDGIVVAGTGNGTVGKPLAAALREAAAIGVPVRVTTRCAAGAVIGEDGTDLTAVQMRVELILELLGAP